MILLPLKLKYRVKKGGTGGGYKNRTGNSHGPRKSTIWAALQASARKRRG